MRETLELPFSQSPEAIFERIEERWPRQYAKDIYLGYSEDKRLQQVDRIVPAHLREMVRFYLRRWAMRERELRRVAR